MSNQEKVEILYKFWEESLSSSKILTKLIFKEKQNNQKLSDKEVRLKQFLLGENKQLLLELDIESNTRKYGELAVINKDFLVENIHKYYAK